MTQSLTNTHEVIHRRTPRITVSKKRHSKRERQGGRERQGERDTGTSKSEREKQR